MDRGQKRALGPLRNGELHLNYDTTNLHTLENDFKPGQTCRKTFELPSTVRFIKIFVDNVDPSEKVSNVKVTATLEG